METDACPRATLPTLRPATRRATLGAALAALAGGAAPRAAAARKKKKGCKFATDPVAQTMTLTADCTTTKTVKVPAGFTLDGAGFTIAAKGKAKGFDGAVVVPKDGLSGFKVADLILDGSGLVAPPEDDPAVDGIRFAGPDSQLHDSTVRQFRNSARAVVSNGANLKIDNATLTNGSRGLSVTSSTVTMTRTTISNVDFGVDVTASTFTMKNGSSASGIANGFASVVNSTATFDTVTITAPAAGTCISVSQQSIVTLTDSTLTTGRIGVYVVGERVSEMSKLDAIGNTITLHAPALPFIYGLEYEGDSTGTADNNHISGFIDSDPGHFGCGIYVSASSLAQIGNGNTFPNPPGNDHDVCDQRS